MLKIQLYQSAKDNIGSEITEQAIIDIIAGKGDAGKRIEKLCAELRQLSVANDINKNRIKSETDISEEFKSEAKRLVDQYDELKRSLQAVTWAGLFCEASIIKAVIDQQNLRTGKTNWVEIFKSKKYQNRTRAIEQHSVDSGLRVADIDKEVITGYEIIDKKKIAQKSVQIASDQELHELKDRLSQDPHVRIVFISPSGNGLKVIFNVGTGTTNEKDVFASIAAYIEKNYGKKIDPSGKDISRLCFLSFDENIYYSPFAQILPIVAAVIEPAVSETDKVKLSKSTKAQDKKLQETGQEPNDIWESTQENIAFTDGNRNNFIFKYACNCNRVGISEMDSCSFAQGFCPDKNPNEIKATVNSAYAHNVGEHGKFKRLRQTGSAPTTAKSNPPAAAGAGGQKNIIFASEYTSQGEADAHRAAAPYVFWKEHVTEKGRGAKKYNSVRLEMVRIDFRNFLFQEGFHLLRTGDGADGFQTVHSKNNIIKPVTHQQIKHYVLDWCELHSLKDVQEMLLKGQTKFFAKNELDSLPYKDVKIKRDTDSETYFYFNNCFVTVKKEKGQIIDKPYTEIDGYIWESSIIDHDYKNIDIDIFTDTLEELVPYEEMNCEFARFVAYCSYNPLNEDEKGFSKQMIVDRFLSFCSAIGFLLDGYKHPSKRTAIFAIDHQISDRYEANGRSGKSIIPQACEQFKKVANISGKTYDPKYQFCDEPITMDSQMINYNDMPRNFDVETIFEKIADNYSVNRRNQGFIHFKYAESPKVYYSTNFTPKGEGDSYKARMTFIEFSDFFNSGNTPYDVFGHGFFDKDSWPEEEWQRFFNYGLFCVAYYKENGLMQYPNPNIEARKLINTVVPEFVDFMDDKEYVPKNKRLKKIQLQEIFNEKFYLVLYNKKLTPHMFTSWMKQYCRSGNYVLNPVQKGKHDKSNGIEYITIADENWQADQIDLPI